MKLTIRLICCVLASGGLVIWAACYSVYQTEIAEGERRVREFWGGIDDEYRPKEVLKPLPPIVRPPAIPAVEAEGKISPNELVLGISINGEARAYPINMLTGPEREIFNDELGGKDIAATW